MARFERLVNLTRQPVHVRCGDELVLLDAEPGPTILEGRDRVGSLVVGAPGGGEVALSVAGGVPAGVLFLPEPREGTAFLVDAEIAARCGPRDDLFAVDAFGVDFPAEGDGPGELVSWLVSVRQVFPPLPDDAPHISDDDFVAAATDPAGGDRGGVHS